MGSLTGVSDGLERRHLGCIQYEDPNDMFGDYVCCWIMQHDTSEGTTQTIRGLVV